MPSGLDFFMKNIDDIFHIESSAFADGDDVLAALCRGSFDFLSGFILPDGEIAEYPSRRRLPRFQYATSFFLLTAAILYRASGDLKYMKALRLALKRVVGNSSAGAEISDNNFALLMTYLLLSGAGSALPGARDAADDIRAMISRLSYVTGPDTTEGNNNYALRLLCEYVAAEILGDGRSASESLEEFRRYTALWQFADGVFCDYPRQTSSEGEFLAPTAYHARFAALVMLCASLTGDGRVLDAGLKAVGAMAKILSSDGDIGYYGRSSCSVFAQSNAFLAFRLAAPYASAGEVFHESARSVRRAIEREYSVGGRFRISAGADEKKGAGYEEYMYNSVYSAYASAVCLLGCFASKRGHLLMSAARPAVGCEHLKDSGFLIFRGSKFSFDANMKGSFFYDERNGACAGARYPLFSFLDMKTAAGASCIPPVPVIKREFFSSVSSEMDTSLSGFEPYFVSRPSEKIVFGRPREVVIKESGEASPTVIEASGEMFRINLSKRSLMIKILAGVARRAPFLSRHLPKALLSPPPREMFRRLAGASYSRKMKVYSDCVLVSYDINVPPACRGFFGARLFPGSVGIGEGYLCRVGEPGGLLMVFDGAGRFKRKRYYPTGKGLADFWEAPLLGPKSASRTVVKSAMMPLDVSVGLPDIPRLAEYLKKRMAQV